MGDIATHKDVNYHLIPQLQAISSAENFTYIEYGNYLTDISQFRDPTAFIGAKTLVFWGGVLDTLFPFLGILGGVLSTNRLRKWLDVMFGEPQPADKRHGALPTFFKHLALGFTHVTFSDTSQHHDKILTPIPEAEIDRVYQWAFTQYFPHEHVDYPPSTWVVDFGRSRRYKPLKRGLTGYLEEHIEFISEELSTIEWEWMKNRDLDANNPVRCDLLVRLGHVLHAVEDFYFHSNIVELRQWNRVLQANPTRRPKEDFDDYRFLVDNSLSGTSYDASSIRLRRRLARRIAYPLYASNSGSLPTVSQRAIGFTYTGGFGSNDIAHTIIGALEGLEEYFQRDHQKFYEAIRLLELPLFRALLVEDERRALAKDDNKLRESIQKHQQQLLNSLYEVELVGMKIKGILTEAAKEAIKQALDLDKQIMLDFSPQPGPGGFLIFLLSYLQTKAETSHEAVQKLDNTSESMYNLDVDNGASEETVGSHSLMAKDSTVKEPFRKEAVALAKFASTALAVLLLHRIQDEPDPTRGLNWDRILRHFVRIPPGKAPSWEEEVLAAINAGGSIPTLENVQDKSDVKLIGENDIAGVLKARRKGKVKDRLEELYRHLEITGALKETPLDQVP